MRWIALLLGISTCYCCYFDNALAYQETIKYTQTAITQEILTPHDALNKLLAGNQRFLQGNMQQRNYSKQAKLTYKLGQAPFAIILSCMDSRSPSEIIFDQGIGDIFALRVAGNIINPDILGSMEYGVKVASAKLIVVMGHTQCGAVAAACKGTELGNITQLLVKIKPAVFAVKKSLAVSCDKNLVNKIAKQNVINGMIQIPKQSSIIAEMLAQKKIMLVGAMHDLKMGHVTFFDVNGKPLVSTQ
jgi:carbonic anhydrase